MDKEVEALLEKEGFIVECYSPFEIYHNETNSRADGHCAKLVVEHLTTASTNEGGPVDNGFKFWLKAENPDYPDIYPRGEENIAIWGVVICILKKLK